MPAGIKNNRRIVFHNVMGRILQGLAGVAGYLNDMLFTRKYKPEHLRNLELVLERLQSHG